MRAFFVVLFTFVLALISRECSAACLFCAGAPTATTTTSAFEPSDAYETQFLGGVQWNFGTSVPELVLGFRQTRTSTDDDVIGGKLDFAFPLNAHFLDGFTVRGMGLAGDRDAQGEFGVGLRGWNFKPLLAAGAQGPYVNGGANYIFGEGFEPYLGANSLSQPRRPRTYTTTTTALSCPIGDRLLPQSFFNPGDSPPASQFVDGKTCVRGVP